MGKPIAVVGSTVVDEVLMLDTDRSITGQDGAAFDSSEIAATTDTFPGRLASRMFDAVTGATHVYVASNQVVVARSGGWDAAAAESAADTVSRLFVVYPNA